MKITGPENLNQSIQGGSSSPKGPNRSANFNDMLRETLDPADSSDAARKSSLLSEPRAVQSFSQPSLEAATLVDRTSHVIDLLDSYTKALSNPHKTLREIEPQLAAFINETQSLYEEYRVSDRDDPALDNVMENLLRTAKLEGIRFHRGDYLDSE